MGLTSGLNHGDVIGTEFGKITQNNGQYTV